jgi:phage terminase small subunit
LVWFGHEEREEVAEMLPKLKPKQARFVRAYIDNGGNATQAAITAGYARKNAGQTGAENLKKPQIEEAIRELTEAREKSAGITAEWVRQQIAQIAQKVEAKDQDRLKALDMLAKMLGLYERKEEEQQGIRVVIQDEAADWAG